MGIKKMVLGVLMLFVVALSGCAGTTPQEPPKGVEVIEFKAPQLGTKTKWKGNNLGKDIEWEAVLSQKEIDGEMRYYWDNPALNKSHVVDAESMNWIGQWSHETNSWIQRAKPSNLRLQFPLWPGKSYKAFYQFSRTGGWSGRVESFVSVSDWEDTTVPAGTFRTLKITQKNSPRKQTVWYSPELGSIVKYEFKNPKGIRTGELISKTDPQM